MNLNNELENLETELQVQGLKSALMGMFEKFGKELIGRMGTARERNRIEGLITHYVKSGQHIRLKELLETN